MKMFREVIQRATLVFVATAMWTATAGAQNPAWAKRAAASVFTLKTFDDSGTLLASSTGCFVSADGEAISSFAPFRGARAAVVIDAQGKECPFDCLLGANDTYDVARFKVATRKAVPVTVAASPASESATMWMLPYAAKRVAQSRQGTVARVENFMEQYSYYTLSLDAGSGNVGCPLLNERGEVVALMQDAASGADGKSNAIDVRYAAALSMTALSINDATFRQTAVDKAVPANINDALLALYVASSAMDSMQYVRYLDRFVAQYPTATDGYAYRARHKMSQADFAGADADMRQAVKMAEKTDDAHYQYASIIYQKELYQPEQRYEPWTLQRAYDEAAEAYRINPMPVYRQLQAQVLFAQQKYEDAFTVYQELSGTTLRSADIFYAASQCQARLGNSELQLAQLDSAVAMFGKPYVRAAAPYIMARAQALHDAGRYRAAVVDYNDYARLMGSRVAAPFYYLREQAEVGGHLYQQALDDIRRAVDMAPEEPMYLAEQAALETRLSLYDEANATAARLVQLAPEVSDGHLFLGLSLCLKGQKKDGLQHLLKAKELGHEQAQQLIDKYAQ